MWSEYKYHETYVVSSNVEKHQGIKTIYFFRYALSVIYSLPSNLDVKL